jgi:hypothetical protein
LDTEVGRAHAVGALAETDAFAAPLASTGAESEDSALFVSAPWPWPCSSAPWPESVELARPRGLFPFERFEF